MNWTVYILKCNDKSYYVGCTRNLEDRMRRHEMGYISYTANRLPFELETFVTFTNKYKAYNFERYLKTGSGIAFMRKRLIEVDILEDRC